MPRQRMIRPEIWTDEGFLSLTVPARLMFIGMISGAYDEGHGLATARCLKAYVFPGDDITLERFGCFRLAARIHDLKGRGHNITTHIVRRGDAEVAEYSMAPAGELFAMPRRWE